MNRYSLRTTCRPLNVLKLIIMRDRKRVRGRGVKGRGPRLGSYPESESGPLTTTETRS